MIKLTEAETTALFTLITSVDFDNSRIVIADHEIESDHFIMYLEDQRDFKENLNNCVMIAITIKEFEKFIAEGHYNAYRGMKIHNGAGMHSYETWIEINSPLAWYREDASNREQQDVREDLVKQIIKDQLIDVQG